MRLILVLLLIVVACFAAEFQWYTSITSSTIESNGYAQKFMHPYVQGKITTIDAYVINSEFGAPACRIGTTYNDYSYYLGIMWLDGDHWTINPDCDIPNVFWITILAVSSNIDQDGDGAYAGINMIKHTDATWHPYNSADFAIKVFYEPQVPVELASLGNIKANYR